MDVSVPRTPRVVGRYAIFDEVASGGMATVYLGRLMGSGGFARTVAIKRLHPQFAKDPEFVAMFLDEARLAARIRHPNVVPTLDVVASRGEVFLVMEYVQGESLSRLAKGLRARGERVPLPILLRIMSDALQGLHAAHEARDERGVPLDLVHRDVTPQNILVGIDGVGRLLDFGIAKAAGRAQTTREGQIKGKLAYMAPEQLTNSGVTRQTDIYAAAVVLWEMLTGERLFSGGSELDLLAKLLKRDIRRPSEIVAGVPAVLDDVVMRGLASDVSGRYATAREMCVALGACGLGEAPSIVVGEWVEQLAGEALANRSAKIAAIESYSDPSGEVTNLDSNRPSGTHTVPPAERKPGPSPTPPALRAAEIPTITQSTSAVVAHTMTTDAIRVRARSRAVRAAAGLGAVVLGGGLLLLLGGLRAAPGAARGASTAATAPHVAEAPASPIPPPPPVTDVPAPVASASAATATVASAARASPPPARPAPATTTRATVSPHPPAAHRDAVFDSRE
jgi:serine/threonine-protein kinase